MRHLTVRVAWHDSGWDARICAAPSRNAYCLAIERVRKDRNDAVEDALAGRPLAELTNKQHPPCILESTPFMNVGSWSRTFEHPYAYSEATATTHGHLATTTVDVPPYSTFAIPFAWMLGRRQQAIEERMVDPLVADVPPPFPSTWVFSGQRQTQLLDHVFSQLNPGTSLVMLYTKSGHPLDEKHSRLLVGVGTLTAVDSLRNYTKAAAGPDQPMWDREAYSQPPEAGHVVAGQGACRMIIGRVVNKPPGAHRIPGNDTGT